MPKGPLRVVRTPTIPENLSELARTYLGVVVRCEGAVAEHTLGCAEGGDGATQGRREADLQGSCEL